MSNQDRPDDNESAIQNDLAKQKQIALDRQKAVEENVTAKVKVAKAKGAKGKGSKAKEKQLVRSGGSSYSPSAGKAAAQFRDQAQCGSCGNPMTMSQKINVQKVEGFKVPKNPATGKYMYKSPGAAEGTLTAVLCDDCIDRMHNPSQQKVDGTPAVDIKRVVIEREGKIVNAPITDIKAGY